MAEPEPPVLGVVVVVYRSPADTAAFVRQQLPRLGVPFRAAVVDLASPAEATRSTAEACGAEVYAGRPGGGSVLFVNHAENLGYARGNNLGAELLLRHFPSIRWLLFSNNDIEIPEPGTAARLIEQLERRPDVGCIGPRVLGLDGADQSPLHDPIPLATVVCRELLSPPMCRLFARWRRPAPPRDPAQETCCYTVMGCFLMVRAADFAAAGMFDPATFLYREEEILSERLLRVGKRTFYYPGVTVRHHGGRTVNRHLEDRRINRLHFESTCYYYRAYRRASALGIGILRLAKRVSLLRADLRRRLGLVRAEARPADAAPRPPAPEAPAPARNTAPAQGERTDRP